MSARNSPARAVVLLLLAVAAQAVLQTPTAADMQVVDQLSYVSFAAYCDSRQLLRTPQWNCGTMCQNGPRLSSVSHCITADRNYAMMGYDANTNSINVVFRGTISTSFNNWMTNLDYAKVSLGASACPACQVHTGFFDAYKGLRTCLVKNFLALHSAYRKSTVRVTGHSLGGAMATLGAVDITLNGKVKVDYFVTYGSPKVGNKDFQTYFNDVIKPTKNFRVTHFRVNSPRPICS